MLQRHRERRRSTCGRARTGSTHCGGLIALTTDLCSTSLRIAQCLSSHLELQARFHRRADTFLPPSSERVSRTGRSLARSGTRQRRHRWQVYSRLMLPRRHHDFLALTAALAVPSNPSERVAPGALVVRDFRGTPPPPPPAANRPPAPPLADVGLCGTAQQTLPPL